MTPSLLYIKEILDGNTKWSRFIKDHPQLEDCFTALMITFKYHPENDGSNKKYPRVTLGDIQEMREDLMHLSAIGVHLAGIAAMFESAVDACEAERKLAKAAAWSELRRQVNRGEREKMTDKSMDRESTLMSADRYRMKSEAQIAGRILSWVRASVRNLTESLQVLIQSSMREERGDARLH